MKRILLSTSAAIALCAASSVAYAADMAVRAPPPLPPLYNWTGFYLGANIGGAWGNADLHGNFTGANWSLSNSGFMGGGQLGYNYQMGAFVLGVEWDFDWTDANKSTGFVQTNLVAPPLQAHGSWDWVTTVAARLGYAADRWLFYTKVGGGWNQTSFSVRDAAGVVYASGNNANSGWMVGGGVEYAFTQNWTGKIEYEYLGLSNRTFATSIAPFAVTVSPNVQTLKFGINYKF